MIVALTLGRRLEKCSTCAPRQGEQPGPIYLHGRLLDEDLVDEAVLLGLAGAHEVVALGVGLDPLDRLAGVLGAGSR